MPTGDPWCPVHGYTPCRCREFRMHNETSIHIASELYNVARNKITHHEMMKIVNEWNDNHKQITATHMLPEMVEFVVDRLFPKYPPTVSYYKTVGENPSQEANSNTYYSDDGQANWGAGHGGEG